MGKNVSFRPQKCILPFNIQDIIQKVDLEENRQPTSVKMVSGIVSVDNFYIFSESYDHFSFKMRFNLELNL